MYYLVRSDKMFILPHNILSTETIVVVPFFEKIARTRRSRTFTEVLCSIYVYVWFLLVWYFFGDIHFRGGTCLFFFFLSALLPVLHHKAKRGPPRQAKYAIHCINAIFSSKETQFAQIFEVKMKIFFFLFIFYSTYVS